MIVDVFEDIVEPGHGFRVNVPRCPAQRVAEALPTLFLPKVRRAAPSEPRGIVVGIPCVASLGFLLVQVAKMLFNPPCKIGINSCDLRSEEHTSELQSLMRISYAVFF